MPDVMLLWAPLVAPLFVAAVAALLGWRPAVARGSIAAAGVILAAGVLAATRTVPDGQALRAGLLRVDSLSALMLLVIGAVALIATWAGRHHLDDEIVARDTDAAGARRYAVLVALFLAAMVLAVSVDNLGVLWVAVEATTIVTAFLVGHRRTRGALEATWKYVMIASVGIALAYLGTVLVYYASRHPGVGSHGSLDWSVLVEQADQLDPGVMRVAFALLVLGFGAKAGLVPMHSWLPDAHSQAPAPVSALMSGVLLSVAVYALVRYRVLAIVVLTPGFVRTLLLAVALASLALAASMLLAQRDYKRLLAYSSIEHMGFAVVGVAVGTHFAITAVLLHLLGHGLGKAVLFCASGQILAAEGSSRIDDVRGLLARRPVLAGTFGLGIVALLGMPPFSLFASELGIVRAGVGAGLGWAVAIALVLLLVAFAAIMIRLAPMLIGAGPGPRADSGRDATVGARPFVARSAPLVTGLVAVAVLGVLAWPLNDLLGSAATVAAAR